MDMCAIYVKIYYYNYNCNNNNNNNNNNWTLMAMCATQVKTNL